MIIRQQMFSSLLTVIGICIHVMSLKEESGSFLPFQGDFDFFSSCEPNSSQDEVIGWP